jgi:RNA polymerase sigma-54 factor
MDGAGKNRRQPNRADDDMPFSLSQNQTQSQVQRQELVPAQIQSLEILQAAMPELERKLNEILASNPAVELVPAGGEPADSAGGEAAKEPATPATENREAEPGTPDAADSREATAGNTDAPPSPVGAAGMEAEFDSGEDADAATIARLERLAESWRDYLPGDSTGHGTPSEEEEERRKHRLDSIAAPVGLQDMLLAQLREQVPAADAHRLRIGEEIIGSIDETGYLRTHVSDIAMACEADPAEVKEVLEQIQQFDPPGIGARDLRECLLLQLERRERKDSLEYQLVSRYLEDLGRNQIPRIARALRVTPGKVYELLQNIRQLRPYPGIRPDNGDAAPTVYIVPEVTVSRGADGGWLVEPNREHRPQLRLSPYYLRLLRTEDTPVEVRQYIRQKVAEGRLLMRALDQRQSTIERITHALIRHQPEFFENGPAHLHPLTLVQLARELGLHETTVGRAIAEKYLLAPHGLFPFRRFFTTGGVAAADGHLLSNHSVKHNLQALVRGEDAHKPLTDAQICQLLARQGIKLARRTVAKYREELGIPPTHLRRSHRAQSTPRAEPPAAPPAPMPAPAVEPPPADDDITIG